MADCLRCGRCCQTAHIALESIRLDRDALEIGRWLRLHRLDTYAHRLPDGTEVLGVRIPLVCRHLENLPDGRYACAIYPERPEVCRAYLCDRAREGDALAGLEETVRDLIESD